MPDEGDLWVDDRDADRGTGRDRDGLLALAVTVEARHPEPIIPLDLFRNRTLTLAVVASMQVGLGLFGGSVFLSQYFQLAQGHSPTRAGLMSLPMILGMLVSSTVAGGLITRYGKWKFARR